MLYLKRGESLTYGTRESLTYGIGKSLTPFEVASGAKNGMKFKGTQKGLGLLWFQASSAFSQTLKIT